MLYHCATWEVLESPKGAFKILAAPDTCQTSDIRMSRHWNFPKIPRYHDSDMQKSLGATVQGSLTRRHVITWGR